MKISQINQAKADMGWKNLGAALNSKIPKFFRVVLAVIYFISLIYLVFFSRRRRHHSFLDVNFVPLQNLLENTTEMTKDQFYNYTTNLFGNIVLFFPFPIILIFCFGKRKAIYLLAAGFFSSGLIEVLQYIFKVGVSDVDDIILNTLGTLLGILALYLSEIVLKPHPPLN